MAKHTPESKEKISKKRKEWLKNNPDKHPWKRKDKFKSEPCENAKRFLKENGILFIEEFSPEIEGRFFSIDIALPDRMIAIEINGNQHYEKNGRLKPYYQERHDLLEKDGWIVFEVHYSACFDEDQWKSFSEKLKSKRIIKEFDYFKYKPKEKKLKYNNCPNCNGLKTYKAKICKPCILKRSKENARKKKVDKKKKTINHEKFCPLCLGFKEVRSKLCQKCFFKKSGKEFKNKKQALKTQWPTQEEMQDLLFKYPMTKISKKLGVSDVAIKKHCKRRGLTFPPTGYWLRKENWQG